VLIAILALEVSALVGWRAIVLARHKVIVREALTDGEKFIACYAQIAQHPVLAGQRPGKAVTPDLPVVGVDVPQPDVVSRVGTRRRHAGNCRSTQKSSMYLVRRPGNQ
jgi:hypothetical protein